MSPNSLAGVGTNLLSGVHISIHRRCSLAGTVILPFVHRDPRFQTITYSVAPIQLSTELSDGFWGGENDDATARRARVLLWWALELEAVPVTRPAHGCNTAVKSKEVTTEAPGINNWITASPLMLVGNEGINAIMPSRLCSLSGAGQSSTVIMRPATVTTEKWMSCMWHQGNIVGRRRTKMT